MYISDYFRNKFLSYFDFLRFTWLTGFDLHFCHLPRLISEFLLILLIKAIKWEQFWAWCSYYGCFWNYLALQKKLRVRKALIVSFFWKNTTRSVYLLRILSVQNSIGGSHAERSSNWFCFRQNVSLQGIIHFFVAFHKISVVNHTWLISNKFRIISEKQKIFLMNFDGCTESCSIAGTYCPTREPHPYSRA